mmetsp:Transcript_18676/g.72047  ORF Transcript_18676/g.72047 Transcript_18676/m.72047 type:complete len:267 (+) Transcript_18676:576-1376(+)
MPSASSRSSRRTRRQLRRRTWTMCSRSSPARTLARRTLVCKRCATAHATRKRGRPLQRERPSSSPWACSLRTSPRNPSRPSLLTSSTSALLQRSTRSPSARHSSPESFLRSRASPSQCKSALSASWHAAMPSLRASNSWWKQIQPRRCSWCSPRRCRRFLWLLRACCWRWSRWTPFARPFARATPWSNSSPCSPSVTSTSRRTSCRSSTSAGAPERLWNCWRVPATHSSICLTCSRARMGPCRRTRCGLSTTWPRTSTSGASTAVS